MPACSLCFFVSAVSLEKVWTVLTWLILAIFTIFSRSISYSANIFIMLDGRKQCCRTFVYSILIKNKFFIEGRTSYLPRNGVWIYKFQSFQTDTIRTQHLIWNEMASLALLDNRCEENNEFAKTQMTILLTYLFWASG